jgi:glycosyltransferase involved in cell wall biosynthesis
VWPAIRKEVPDAELHVFYGSQLLRKVDLVWAQRIADKMEALADQGVVDRGRVGPAVLAREMLSAGVFLHPSWHADRPWTETYGIVAVEAQAAGLRVVCGSHGALRETVRSPWAFVDGDPRDGTWPTHFAVCAADALSAPEAKGQRAMIAASVSHMTWDAVVDRFESVLSSCPSEVSL